MMENGCCIVCGWSAPKEETERTWEHCPNCLSSIHAYDKDEIECGGIEEPVSIWVQPSGQWQLISRCNFCGEMHASAVEKWDSKIKLLSIAAKPIAQPPFPIERMQELTALMGGQGEVGGYFDESGK